MAKRLTSRANLKKKPLLECKPPSAPHGSEQNCEPAHLAATVHHTAKIRLFSSVVLNVPSRCLASRSSAFSSSFFCLAARNHLCRSVSLNPQNHRFSFVFLLPLLPCCKEPPLLSLGLEPPEPPSRFLPRTLPLFYVALPEGPFGSFLRDCS